MRLPKGYEPIMPGRSDIYWREKGSYIDEIQEIRGFSLGDVKYYANRFKKKNDEIIKEKTSRNLREIIDFLEK